MPGSAPVTSFRGFVSSAAFTEARFKRSDRNPFSGQLLGIDNVSFTTVPAPGALVLSVLAIGVVALARRR